MKRIIFAICTILCANVLLAQTRFWIDDLQYEEAIRFYDGYSSHIEGVSVVNKITAKKVDKDKNSDVYIVAKDFSWTYVRTHECYLGPYLCVME